MSEADDETIARAIALVLTGQTPHGSTLRALVRRGLHDGVDLTDEGLRSLAWEHLKRKR